MADWIDEAFLGAGIRGFSYFVFAGGWSEAVRIGGGTCEPDEFSARASRVKLQRK
jgi:hypothetical protein